MLCQDVLLFQISRANQLTRKHTFSRVKLQSLAYSMLNDPFFRRNPSAHILD